MFAVRAGRLDVVAIVLAFDLGDGGVTGGSYLFVDRGIVSHWSTGTAPLKSAPFMDPAIETPPRVAAARR